MSLSLRIARRPSRLGGGGSARLLSGCIGVAFARLDDLTMAVANPLDQSSRRADIEPSAHPNGHPPHMHTSVLPAWHHRPHQIARAQAEPSLLPRHMPHREAVLM